MLDILKKKTNKSYIIRTIVLVVIAVLILVFTDFAVFDAITGPTKIDLTKPAENYEGKYVTVDVENFLTDYVEHSTTTTNTKTGSKRTSVDGNSYIVFNAVDDYANSTSTWYYFSVYMNKSKQSDLYNRIDETWEYWNDETGTVAPPETLTVTGTWEKLDSKLLQYYQETLDEMGVTAGDYDIIYMYHLVPDEISGLPVPLFWILMVGVLVLLIAAVLCIIKMAGGAYAKHINKFIHDNNTLSLATIEADFSQAHLVGNNVWVGKKWTVYVEGSKAKIVDNKELVWGYYYKQTGRYHVSQLRLFTAAKKSVYINMSESLAHEALKYYSEEQPQMITGYSSDLEKSYQKTFNDFLNMKYNPAKAASEADSYFNNSYYGTQEEPKA